MVDRAYIETLSNLFQVVKGPPRHSDLNADLAARKTVFNDACNKHGLAVGNVIHVAGTKGKGSTVEYIASGLRAQGFNVGVFTSPHLHTARERIKIGRDIISKEDFTRCGNTAMMELNGKPWAVFFDLLLLTAIQYFGTKRVDYIILETGIGGRYDSTNFIESPTVAVITSISLDHQAILGDTIEEIAGQKAGIIKPHAHVFTTSKQPGTVLEVFQKECSSAQAQLHVVPAERSSVKDLGVPGLRYDFQVENACLAKAVLGHLKVPSEGMKNFYWPCRMESFVAYDVEFVVDGCHNGQSVQLFLAGLRRLHCDKAIIVVFGGGKDKSLKDMLGHLFAEADHVIFSRSSHFRAASERDLVDATKGFNIDCGGKLLDPAVGGDPLSAAASDGGTIDATMQWLLASAKRSGGGRLVPGQSRPAVVAVCGSLFIAAEARQAIFKRHPELFSKDDWVREADDFTDL